jgi:outer membrane protein OmpA-like peptidoglycan-associated protein
MFAPVDSVQPPPAAGSASPKSKDEKPWAVWLKEVRLEDHAIDFEDRTLPTPARLEVRSLTIKTRDVRIPIKEALPIEVGMQLNETGTIRVNGSVLPNPPQADVTLALKDIAIRPFQPYFEKFVRVDVQSGTVNLDGTMHLATDHPNGPLMSYEGNVRVEGLSVADRDQGDEVASLQTLSLNKVLVTVDPTTVSIKEVGLQQLMAHLVVRPEGALNLGRLAVVAQPSASVKEKPGEPPQKAKSPPVPMTIGVVKLTKAAATFRDDSVQPPVQTGISNLTGTIKRLSSKQLTRADVDLSGRVGKLASLKIAGTINPLTEDTFTDLTISLGGMDLTAQGPYSSKYVGYGLSKGKLSLDLRYKISQKQLEAENKVVVDQLTFGAKVDSPDATSLPVMLAVALLKDRHGRIDIDLPIRGDLKDPDFKYGKAVLSVLLNLLTKIVASPFTLIGSLVPGGGDEESLQFIAFDPGSSLVSNEESKKLEVLAKGLEERPGLRLDITGTADPARDRLAIGLRKLSERLIALRQREWGQASLKSEELSSEDELRLVTELYERQREKNENTVTSQPTAAEPAPLTLMDMKQRLAAAIPVDESELRALARERAEQVRDQLLEVGKLAEQRVFLQDTDPTVFGNDQVRSRLTIAAGS